MSNVSLPNSTILKYYYYFSTFTFVLTLIFAPFVFYIILTQSKNLKSFKWFLTNQLIWNILLECVIGIFKIVMLLPTASFYLSISDNPYVTALNFICILILGLMAIVSVILTFLNRYFTIFPSIMGKFFNPRNLVIFGIILFAVTITPFVKTFKNFMSTDINNSYQNAREKDIFFKELNEPSMMFFPDSYWKPYAIYIVGVFIVGLFLNIIVLIYFIRLVQKNLTPSVAKVQRSLFIIAILQSCFAYIFLIFPCAILAFVPLIEIPNSAFISCIMFSIMSCHSLLDFIIILTFITPYRKFIMLKFKKLCKKRVGVLTNPTPATSNNISNRRI